MRFQKGQPKIGGRRPGTPNKISRTVRERLEQSSIDPIGRLLAIAENSESPLELQAKVFMDLISYCFPKLKSMQLSTPALSDFSLDELRAMLSKIATARDPNAKPTIQ